MDDSIYPNFQIWKLGCNWGRNRPDFFNFIKEKKIVLGASVKKYSVDDLVIITSGFTVKAIARIINNPQPVTLVPEFKTPFKQYEIDYDEEVIFSNAEWFVLKNEEQFLYKLQQGITKVQDKEIQQRVLELWQHRFKTSLEAQVVYAYLVESKSHHQIQKEILGIPAPSNGGGFETMDILHKYKIDGAKKGIIRSKVDYESELLSAKESYLEALKLIQPYFQSLPTSKPPFSLNEKNIILYGPPGTGKTYNAIDLSVYIVTNRWSENHKENKLLYDKFVKSGQIEFITFHQNYTYEDFVVGIKPDINNDELKFIAHKGIFYQIALRARTNYDAAVSGTKGKDFESVLSEILSPFENGEELKIEMTSGAYFKITNVTESTIYFSKPGGDSYNTLSIKRLEEIVKSNREIPIGLTSYYMPLVKLIKTKLSESERKESTELVNYVLIIDEINRANISKVFGELITLLEEDKRLGAENEILTTLQNGEANFGLPPNLFILGTMNTADKSIALIDIALRRRFRFIGKYPCYENYDKDAIELLRYLNNEIYERKKSPDYLIGHAYFMSGNIEQTLKNKVIPLMLEYFSGRIDIVEDLFSNCSWKVTFNKEKYEWVISKN